MKKILALVLALVLCFGLVACGGGSADEEVGSVYFLNFKPEQDAQWQAIAAAYTEATGVEVTVVTAASGEYETTLTAEIAKSEPPTLFQVNGPNGLLNWKDYCADLSDTQAYATLTSTDYVLTSGDTAAALGYVIESYGIIVNKTLLAQAGYSVEDIDSFADLKAVAEDITARSGELGFAAFTSPGMDGSSDWRFKTHLANLPIYFEYLADGISTTTELKGTYLDNYRAMWDLYINNTTCDSKELTAKTGDDSRNEFLASKAVFFQNGSWEYGQLIGEGKFAEEDLTMIPIYFGVGDEANQGLCTGCENYWCVNVNASEADIAATKAFVDWCVASEEGAKVMAEQLGFVIPYDAAVETPNIFVKKDAENTANGLTPVLWNFTTMPSEEWKNGVGSALAVYAADQTDANWDAVVTAFVDGWASEYALLNG